MRSWSHHMPQGMHLKSEGFASNLYDPEAKFSLKAYCAEHSIPYADIGLPVAIETFIAYGMEFQRRYVPELQNVNVTSLAKSAGYFELATAAGHIARARRVVVAAGIVNFAYLPPQLAAIPGAMVSHSSRHSDLSGFKGRKVAVLGARRFALGVMGGFLGGRGGVVLVPPKKTDAFHQPAPRPRPPQQNI